jgi:hypothetical protein
LRERIKKIKEAEDIPPKDKQKILKVLKDGFGKVSHLKEYFES